MPMEHPSGSDQGRPISPDSGRQISFDELGERLVDTTFVVVDLETTGGSSTTEQITEIGAVKVRGGEVLGEFATLVDPQRAIPPFIAVLTGITDAMVCGSPTLETALPSFLDWAAGSVLVAHNAPFDVGFLRAGCNSLEISWPGFAHIDTARLARRTLTRDEAPDCKLATLARLFRATTTPCHRALADARATVDVLHGLFERLGGLGIQTLEELRTFTGMATAGQRRKRHLADAMPDGPGVYVFRDSLGRPLYIGRSRNLRHRVRQYFTASEPRSRIAEMVGIAERVDAIPCAHDLDAAVREVRMIAEHKPRYNRRSKFPERGVWLVLTDEAFPRLSLVHRPPGPRESHLGPFGTTRAAQSAAAALYDVVPLRQCTQRIAATQRRPGTSCALAGMHRCGAPCEGHTAPEAYQPVAAAARAMLQGDVTRLIETVELRLLRLSSQQRFEEAAMIRDRAATFVRTAWRMQRLGALSSVTQVVAARPTGAGGWDLAAVHQGRLVGAIVCPPGGNPREHVDAMLHTAESVGSKRESGGRPAWIEESELILRWLGASDARLVAIDGQWSSPIHGPGSAESWLQRTEAAREPASPLDDRRGLRPVSRPARAV